jgi:hypothetical protein
MKEAPVDEIAQHLFEAILRDTGLTGRAGINGVLNVAKKMVEFAEEDLKDLPDDDPPNDDPDIDSSDDPDPKSPNDDDQKPFGGNGRAEPDPTED